MEHTMALDTLKQADDQFICTPDYKNVGTLDYVTELDGHDIYVSTDHQLFTTDAYIIRDAVSILSHFCKICTHAECGTAKCPLIV